MSREAKHVGGERAEALMEAWLRSQGFDVERRKGQTALYMLRDRAGIPITDRHGKPKFTKTSQDIFGCIDLLAMRDSDAEQKPQLWFLQVTTDSNRTARKRKVERRKWPTLLLRIGFVRVSIVTHHAIIDPSDERRNQHFWRFDDAAPDPETGDIRWSEPRTIQFEIDPLRRKPTLSAEQVETIHKRVRARRAARRAEREGEQDVTH